VPRLAFNGKKKQQNATDEYSISLFREVALLIASVVLFTICVPVV
jgi:hypothetical protein